MITDILSHDRILFFERGDYFDALSVFLERFDAEQRSHLEGLTGERIPPYSFLPEGVAIPHARMPGIGHVEALLVISRDGLMLGQAKLNVILFLVTPEEEPTLHLQLLQGLSSLMPRVAALLKESPEAPSIQEGFEKEPSTGYVSQILEILEDAEKNLRPTFINLTQQQVAFELHTDPVRGLSRSEAEERLREYGLNLIRKSRSVPWYVRLLRDFFSFFSILLWFAAALCFIPGVDMPQLGIAILIVILVNGIFAFIQEYRSDRAVESLQNLITPRCRVIRDGEQSEIESSQLVPGDLILIEEGDIVPADARLIEAFEIEVDNSSLTGESNSAKRYKSDKPDLMVGRFLWIELPNILFAGSTLVRGSGKALVFGTGMNSEIGKIAGMTLAIKSEESPLQKQLRSTVYSISLLAFSIGFVLLLLGWKIAGLEFAHAFLFFIGVFVANVPEGLLPTVTLSLAMAVTRMASRNALVKNLSAVETLGCTTVICCDKTGTLTQNVQMVNRVLVDDSMITVEGRGYEPTGRLLENDKILSRDDIAARITLRKLLICSVICNNARLESMGGSFRVLGDPTEGALLTLAARADVRGVHQRIHLNPFESVRKRMSVVVRIQGEPRKISYMKGGPTETLERCDSIMEHGVVRPMMEHDRVRIINQMDEMANQGLRILALAYRDDETLQKMQIYDVESVEQNHTFLGLTAMTDPIRPEVPDAIRKCHTAGIRVNMITGDYPLTAASIARQVGIGESEEKLPVISGSELAAMENEELKSLLRGGESIFARVSPDQKLRIVTALKDLGEIVAVTGDGVNDGPALKKADIGVAMGLRGTDVARESAQMILADDNFASIVAAIEEGRGVFQNIKRFSAYVFNSNPQELYPYIFWMLIPGFPLAMTVMGVLAVDVGTDLIPAMGLGAEPPEMGIMERPPRRRDEKVLSLRFILENYFVEGSILAFASFATYYYFGWMHGYMTGGFSFFGIPASPPALNMSHASGDYLMSLTAYFFPTIATQIGNVLARRSASVSLFSRDFLSDRRRQEIIDRFSHFSPVKKTIDLEIRYRIETINQPEAIGAFLSLLWNTIYFPVRLAGLGMYRLLHLFHRPIVSPFFRLIARILERHYILLNLFSNPLVNFGIAFELLLGFLFFYSDLSHIYYFKPVPWHVYLFSFHGMVLMILFSELKKYFIRRRDAMGRK